MTIKLLSSNEIDTKLLGDVLTRSLIKVEDKDWTKLTDDASSCVSK